MKTTSTLILVLIGFMAGAQTLTYANFSSSLTQTLSVIIANNTSYNTALSTTTGSNVTWNASALIQQASTPTINLSYHPSSGTPQGSQYPNSNYSEYDPALISMVSYNYCGINTDSLVEWGTYASNGTHEIFQNPDKRLIFPFSYGQSFNDTYAKTNYSNATTISSFQTGTRTVTFSGFGTLILPQGSFSNVALISEVRTNSLGPDSYNYSWMRISDGKRLLFRSENNGSITTVWNTEATSGIEELSEKTSIQIFPNPTQSSTTLKINSENTPIDGIIKIIDMMGKVVKSYSVNTNEIKIEREGLENGIYFCQLQNKGLVISTEKLIIQ